VHTLHYIFPFRNHNIDAPIFVDNSAGTKCSMPCLDTIDPTCNCGGGSFRSGSGGRIARGNDDGGDRRHRWCV